jgi:hypothetical protein
MGGGGENSNPRHGSAVSESGGAIVSGFLKSDVTDGLACALFRADGITHAFVRSFDCGVLGSGVRRGPSP